MTSDDVFDLINNDRDITSSIRLKMSSVTTQTLVERLADLRDHEYSEVYRLEEQNIFYVLNAVRSCTINYSAAYCRIITNMGTIPSAVLNSMESTETEPSIFIKDNFLLLTKYFLCADAFNTSLRPHFIGKVPQKLFSFRQSTAEEWYKQYCNYTLYVTDFILRKLGPEEAFAYILGYTAYYLNRSQPYKYRVIPEDKNMNDTIFRILKKYINSMDDGKSEKTLSSLNELFRKTKF